MENLSTLTGKYGEEGDQLLFRILNSGDFLKEADPLKLESKNSRQVAPEISKKGLRYDLTVPFARYVVMNRNEVSFPFKRYQIQPVWRADRPQKGRYQEFYQCDADVVGTDSLVCEAEIILMIKEVFRGLNITDYTIKINHRGVLSGLAEVIGAQGNETPLFVAIDKLDKIGEEKVKEELRTRGFTENSLTGLFDVLNVKGSTVNKLAYLATRFETSAGGQKGLRDLQEVFNILKSYGATEDHVEFDIALARGLSYYTGCIFEVKINNVSIGSVSGGGRYDNLTQAFGDKDNLSGVGFSFGVDRIYDAMDELNAFPKDTHAASRVLICHLDAESMYYGLGALTQLRGAGIASEIYPDTAKLKKQLEYANKKMIPFTVVIGSDEMKSGLLALKNMEHGTQETLTIDQIIEQVKP
jgi:histidyl-tRNA synthetase